MSQIELILPLPVSVNQAYAGVRVRRKSDVYKVWERECAIAFDNQIGDTEIIGDEWLEVEYTYYMPIYCKNGDKKVIDVFNYEKVLSDFMAKKLSKEAKERIPGFQDHKILQGTVRKVQSDRNEVEVIIREINEDFTYSPSER